MDWGTFLQGVAVAAVPILTAWGVYEGLRHKRRMEVKELDSKLRKQDSDTEMGILPEYKELMSRYEKREAHWENACATQDNIIKEYQQVERECHAHTREMRIWSEWAVGRITWLRAIAEKEKYEVGPDMPAPPLPPEHDGSISFRARNVSQTVKLLQETTPVIQPTQPPNPLPKDAHLPTAGEGGHP